MLSSPEIFLHLPNSQVEGNQKGCGVCSQNVESYLVLEFLYKLKSDYKFFKAIRKTVLN